MPYKSLEYVLKVAETKNITRAASELFLSQSALSHYIARIEQEFGTKIFNRNTNPISLTAAGEQYVETAHQILSLDMAMRQRVEDMAAGRRGKITLTLSHARASYLLPLVLPDFTAQFPNIDLKTMELRSDLAEERILSGRCDMGVLPLPVHSDQLASEVIFQEELVLTSKIPLPFAEMSQGRPYISLKKLQHEPFVLLKKGHGIRTAIDVLFMEHDINPQSILETTSNETAFRLSTTGMALSIVPQTTIALSNPIEPFHTYSLSPTGIYWEIAAVYRRREHLTPAQEGLIRCMQGCHP